MRTRMSPTDCKNAIKSLDGWEASNNTSAICKNFAFSGFKEALSFMNRVGEVAERLDHHPDWSNSYNRVMVRLTTHSAKGLTRLDFELAQEMDVISKDMNRD